MRKLSVAIGILLIILGAVGLRFMGAQKKPAERKPVVQSLKQVQARMISNSAVTARLEVTGRLIARDKIDVYAEVTGVLQPTRPPFKEGNVFRKGQALIKIDDSEHQMNLLAQKSSLQNQITLMLPDLKLDYPDSYPQWETYLREMDIKEPLKDLPESKSDQERYFVSAKNVYNLFYTIQSQETRSEKYTLTAPFSGVVATSSITEGTLVRNGQKLGEFINTYSYELEAAVNVADIDLVSSGNSVIISSDAVGGEWKGRIVRISDRIDPATQTVKVFIGVSGKNLREGMYMDAEIEGRKISDVVELPRSLLVSSDEVYVIKDSMLRLQKIDPVYFSSSSMVVKGIPDETLLLNESVIGAYDGMKVGIYQAPKDSISVSDIEGK